MCLHCRYEARVAARERRTRLFLRSGAGIIVLATIGAAGAVGTSAIRGHAATRAPRQVDSGRAPTESDSAVPVVSKPATPTPHSDGAPIATVLPMGQSTLIDGVVASRTDSGIVVSFDAPMLRTRMPEKFEHLLRQTLPAIYGATADSALAKLPWGSIARQGDLLTELPLRGVRVPLSGGWTITVYPETRPGQDGPLVVRYRTALMRA